MTVLTRISLGIEKADLSLNSAEELMIEWRFDNSYPRLPEELYAAAQPIAVKGPRVSVLNHRLASELGLSFEGESADTLARIFTGQELPVGSQPIAQAYAGHQYGQFTMLGDGRAILLGEHCTPTGRRVDIQFKGAGPTRFSRRGDGRAALGPMLREYIISEAMAALGIPTTRSLAVATTGEAVYRTSLLRGAVLTRVAASHVRVGTFEYAARLQNPKVLKALTDYTIARHDPELVDSPEKYLEFLRAVIARQAKLIAQWQLVGFVHGVMNTDNMAISGETIDYGPCAFMNRYRTDTVFSSIDHQGRYAYGNQPAIAQWNLARFAESLLPLLSDDQERSVEIATDALNAYVEKYQSCWRAGMRSKLGLTKHEDGDQELGQSLLDWMEAEEADFTNTFRELSETGDYGVYSHSPKFRAWHNRWLNRLGREERPLDQILSAMCEVNPAVIPRNHRAEEALAAAEAQDDLSVMHRLLDVLSTPFSPPADSAAYREPAPDDNYQTYCGT